MKKVLFASAVALVMISGLNSCSKCQNCQKPASDEIRICEKDYDSNTLYGAAIDAYEIQGYVCK
jgi:hypothetical protein